MRRWQKSSDLRHRIREMRGLASEPLSLNSPVSNQDDDERGDFVEDPDAVAPFDAASQAMLSAAVSVALQFPHSARAAACPASLWTDRRSRAEETLQSKNFDTTAGRGAAAYEKGIDTGLLLPGQYVDLVRRNHVIEGELKLLLAVLEDAIRCYLRNVDAKDGERRRDFVEVRSWFEGGMRRRPPLGYLQF